MNKKKEYEECQSFQECVDELVRRTIERIEKEMPDEGGFADIFELFCNPDADTSDIVGKYGLQNAMFRRVPTFRPLNIKRH